MKSNGTSVMPLLLFVAGVAVIALYPEWVLKGIGIWVFLIVAGLVFLIWPFKRLTVFVFVSVMLIAGIVKLVKLI
ncbi:MAG TPA: hypothetical protein VFA81_13265 [Burkholderiales bacterium]|nr:hypothetical protein [Burkholderiales bacterium]